MQMQMQGVHADARRACGCEVCMRMRGVYARADARRACGCGCKACMQMRGVYADARHVCVCGCEACMRMRMRGVHACADVRHLRTLAMSVASCLQVLFPGFLRLDRLVGVLQIRHDAVDCAQLALVGPSCTTYTPLQEGERLAVLGITLINVTIGAESVRRCAHGGGAHLRLREKVHRGFEECEAYQYLWAGASRQG